MADPTFRGFDNLNWFYQPDQHSRMQDARNSMSCLSPGTSTIGGSAESSVLLAITPITASLSSFLEPRVGSDSLSNSVIYEPSMKGEYAGNSLVKEAPEVHTVDSIMRRKLLHGAPRLSIIPLPQFNVEIYSSSPAATNHQASGPRLRRSKSIVFVEDDESETSPDLDDGTIEEERSDGDQCPSCSIFNGLGITIDDHLTPQDDAMKSTPLRRVDGCVNLKSLWFEVPRAVRSPSMSARSNWFLVLSLTCLPVTSQILRPRNDPTFQSRTWSEVVAFEALEAQFAVFVVRRGCES